MAQALTTIKPPSNMRFTFRSWPTNLLVQVRPNEDRPDNVLDVLLDGEPIGQVQWYTRRIRSKVGGTNFVREHAQRKAWEAVTEELRNASYDRRWEAVRDVIINHQRATAAAAKVSVSP